MHNSDHSRHPGPASSAQLLRSTILAAASAAAILVTVVLPADYGIDPTGIGRMLQLTEMGEIKIQLAKDAHADKAATASRASIPEKSIAAAAVSATPARAEPEQPKVAAAEIPAAPAEQPQQPADARPEPANADPVVKVEPVVPPPPPESAASVSPPAPAPSPAAAMTPKIKLVAPDRKDEMKVVLKPGQGAEIKMQMKQGATANYAWSITGGVVSFDAHGDGANENAISYEKGRGVDKKEGVLKAAFDGIHGWYWRNRGTADVAVILRTEGEYSGIQRME